MINVFCDGGCRPTNPGHAAFGTVFIWDDGTVEEFAEYLGIATNNVAEIEGFRKALDILIERNKTWEPVVVNTDSQYVIGIFSKNWKAKANTQIIGEIRKKLENFPNLTFNWVKAHQGNKYNEMADSLATENILKAIQKLKE